MLMDNLSTANRLSLSLRLIRKQSLRMWQNRLIMVARPNWPRASGKLKKALIVIPTTRKIHRKKQKLVKLCDLLLRPPNPMSKSKLRANPSSRLCSSLTKSWFQSCWKMNRMKDTATLYATAFYIMSSKTHGHCLSSSNRFLGSL